MTRFFLAFAFLILVSTSPVRAAIEAGPLVTPSWLNKHLGELGLIVLDVRGRDVHNNGHVPGAIPTDYDTDGWRIKMNDVPGMLPPLALLESLIGGLGISNADHVVIVPQGVSATEMGVATRIYWTFKVMGHEAVSILDGGMNDWNADPDKKIATGAVQVAPVTFKATMNQSLLATADEVLAVVDAGGAGTSLIDHRPTDQYLGINKSGIAQRYGTVPGAQSAPAMWATVNDGGRFRDAESLKDIYAAAGIATEGKVINFCNTGHWASVGWFVSHELLGNKDAKMYDGSMAEWTRNTSRPMQSLVPQE